MRLYSLEASGAHRAEDDDRLDIRVLQRAHVGVDGRDEHADVDEVRLDLLPLKVVGGDEAGTHEHLRVGVGI